MKTIIFSLISFYQRTISLDHGPLRKFFPGEMPIICRYYPTCSDYMKDAVLKYGSIKGIVLGTQRIFRCHPWSTHPTHDPVP